MISLLFTLFLMQLHAESLPEQRLKLIKEIKKHHNYKTTDKLESIFKNSRFISQGNPKITKHPVSKKMCLEKYPLKTFENKDHEKICGQKYMAPFYDKKNKLLGCIDKFEFPNIPCEYPVVWTRTDEAATICKSIGKRLCDAHEWEGSCSGTVIEDDYFFQNGSLTDSKSVKKMRTLHNDKYKNSKDWAYGKVRKKGICGANSTKDKGCNGGDWQKCGSNTYPSGYFPKCKSKLDVYDQHGNVAEHMNLPLSKDQIGGEKGVTEMKGSWFIFDKYKAHQDWCRWRAPFWHGTKTMHKKSHHNYHLGFRCCSDPK